MLSQVASSCSLGSGPRRRQTEVLVEDVEALPTPWRPPPLLLELLCFPWEV